MLPVPLFPEVLIFPVNAIFSPVTVRVPAWLVWVLVLISPRVILAGGVVIVISPPLLLVELLLIIPELLSIFPVLLFNIIG